MQKVITINLNGNAYQIDESGYAALVAYLDVAERQLKDNPDRAEIVKDLEQAIADKCRGFLGPHKTVVTSAEVDQIVREMGPVEGADTRTDGASGPAADAGPQPSGRTGPRRLYRIQEGAVWMGVCTGLAAYVHIDVVFVRILFLVLIVMSAGWGLIGYWILARIIPEASTSDEHAAAYGQLPLNAQDLIDRAKKNYSDFKDRRDWGRHWRREHREWRRQWRAMRWQSHWGNWGGWGSTPPPSPGAYGSRMFAGIMVPILTLMSMGLFCFWLFAIFSLVTRQEVLGQPLPDEVPLWLGIIILMVLYQAAAWPLHMMRRSSYYALGAYHGALSTFDGFLSLAFVVFGIWLAFHYIPEVREFLQQVPDILRSFRDSVAT